MASDPRTKPISVLLDMRDEPLPPVLIPKTTAPDAITRPHRGSGDVLAIPDDAMVRERLLETVRSARDILVFSSFLLSDEDLQDELMKAAERGVRVYGLTSIEAKLGREIRNDDKFGQKTAEEHRRMLDRFAGHIFLRSSLSFHAKCLLADPHTSRPRGYLLTANLTAEALTRNEELAVRLSPEAGHAVYEHLRYAMWEMAERELTGPGQVQPISPLKEVLPPKQNGSVLATMPDNQRIREELLRLIQSARRRIIVASFGWDPDHPVVEALCDRTAEGIAVTILARRRPNMDALVKLRKAGARVLCFPYLHAKALVADDEGIIMSANLQRQGLDTGFELGIRLERADTQRLATILGAWSDRAPWRLEVSARVGNCLGEVFPITSKEPPPGKPITIEKQTTRRLDDIVAESADQIESAELSESQLRQRLLQKHGPVYAHEVVCEYNICAPRLPRGAKLANKSTDRRQDRNDPQIYRLSNGERVVAIITPDDLSRARRLAHDQKINRIMVTENTS